MPLKKLSKENLNKFKARIIERLAKGATDEILAEINRIKNLRKTDLSKRIDELGKDLDKGGISLIEGKAGSEIEESYGYFRRFKSTSEKKGDWIH